MENLHPFDQPDVYGFILKNHAGQYSFWPAFLAIPAGWQPVSGPQPQEQCLLWLETHWTDIRPEESPNTGSRYV
ncbi:MULTISPECIES: MbtH family NRPS accessory protein [Tatumella]|uniref:MbtH family protein n=1 Tax=Tatumella punctata TaxID=399969 RepID=A0ABW1VN80_9GAMM|nr:MULTISPECIES: MbtH family NRPS accessory protein [unclassified Tatumella]MBS0856412.1 MbtH family NRPS accessory protein [Tatumella sp. JGM16]MBS0877370.1 MbtH family NRPS accessory protein [Tatumella sp. JGM82]MBS0890757.1 MbtH family NRPS accessory protein [Tatumella sp. JGM94]MBS0893457.1 MbtH family NRPS accessory protein [Tatumella sp. JGM130]MBS0901767.1 MbtH family NRPS accessory protein [Tatumella sp. JGM100]